MSGRDAAASSSEPDHGPSRGRAVRLVGLLLVGVVLGAMVTLAIQDRGVTGRAAIGEAAPDAADGPGGPALDRGSDGSGPPTRSVLAGARGGELITVLGQTGRLEFVYSVLVGAGLALEAWV